MVTLGFHHYANSFVGGALFYALLTNGQIRFPRCGAWIAWVAPLLFISAYPFVHFALFRSDASMAELARPGAWQSYYDAVFPIAPVVVGGVIYGLLHPSDSPLSRIMRTRVLRKTGELSFGVYLVHIPMIVFFGSRYGYGPWQFCASIGMTFAGRKVRDRFRARPGPMGSGGPQGQAGSSIAAEREFELMMR
ncbi:MAG TPA: acyltransferase family protein [Roseiarcus sp.]|jgi:peptidoglycan/LPS O-acetylase OafA/YrhL|nr:acyltransferase family protein [Roseiarcus sp.]